VPTTASKGAVSTVFSSSERASSTSACATASSAAATSQSAFGQVERAARGVELVLGDQALLLDQALVAVEHALGALGGQAGAPLPRLGQEHGVFRPRQGRALAAVLEPQEHGPGGHAVPALDVELDHHAGRPGGELRAAARLDRAGLGVRRRALDGPALDRGGDNLDWLLAPQERGLPPRRWRRPRRATARARATACPSSRTGYLRRAGAR
jgi:hypothetical protein